jgi:hypothetical protein
VNISSDPSRRRLATLLHAVLYGAFLWLIFWFGDTLTHLGS